jgi:hypothetical protein
MARITITRPNKLIFASKGTKFVVVTEHDTITRIEQKLYNLLRG